MTFIAGICRFVPILRSRIRLIGAVACAALCAAAFMAPGSADAQRVEYEMVFTDPDLSGVFVVEDNRVDRLWVTDALSETTWDTAEGSVLSLHGIRGTEGDLWLDADFWYRGPGTWPELYFDDSSEVWIYPSGASHVVRGTHRIVPVPEPEPRTGLAVACVLIAGAASLRRRKG